MTCGSVTLWFTELEFVRSHVRHDIFIGETFKISVSTNIYIYVYIYIYIKPDTLTHVQHDSYARLRLISICATWRFLPCNLMYSYVKQETCVCKPRAQHPHICVTWLIFMCTPWNNHMRDMTHICVTRLVFICTAWNIHMRWLRLVGLTKS